MRYPLKKITVCVTCCSSFRWFTCLSTTDSPVLQQVLEECFQLLYMRAYSAERHFIIISPQRQVVEAKCREELLFLISLCLSLFLHVTHT